MPVRLVTSPAPPPGYFVVELDDTAAGSTTEIEIDPDTLRIPMCGRVLEQSATLVSGSGTTIAPRLATVSTTTAPGIAILVEDDGSGANPANALLTGGRYNLRPGAKLYHRSRPNAGSDNVVITRYVFSAGWK